MTWVVEIETHIDYFKDNGSNTTTFIAKTVEEAKTLAVMFMLDRLDDSEFRPIERLDSTELTEALLSKDIPTMYEALSSRAHKIWAGEYVSQTLAVCVYKRQNEYDTVDQEALTKLFDSMEDWLG